MIFNSYADLKGKFSAILSCDRAIVSLLLGTLGFIIGIGFIFSTNDSIHYKAILDFASAYMWSITFISYGVIKFVEVLIKLNKYLVFIISIIGMWLWNYLFISSALFGNSTIAPMEMLIAIPLLCEVWALAAILYTTKQSKCRKVPDGSN